MPFSIGSSNCVVYYVIVVAVFKRSAEEENSFAVYAGDKILQIKIVNMPEVLASEKKQSNP